MQNSLQTLPLELRTTGLTTNPTQGNQGAGIINPSASGASTQSWSAILKAVHGSHHHHGGGGGGGAANSIGSSTTDTDAFGVSDTEGGNPSTDAFGATSSTASSTAGLIASISDPFSSIASNLSVQAQLQSQQLLDV